MPAVSTAKKKDWRSLPRKAGRPPIEWANDYCELARKFCRLGATNEQLAEFFEVSVAQIYHWMDDKPGFREALLQGRAYSDAHIADAMYHRAKGYEHKAVKIFMVKDVHETAEGKETITRPEIVEYVEHYPPDTEAGKFWLKNRQPAMWRDRVDVAPGAFGNVTNIDNRVQTVVIEGETPVDEAAKRYQQFLGRG